MGRKSEETDNIRAVAEKKVDGKRPVREDQGLEGEGRRDGQERMKDGDAA